MTLKQILLIIPSIIIISSHAEYLMKVDIQQGILFENNLNAEGISNEIYNYISNDLGKLNWKKCFDSSIDGYSASSFHNKCGEYTGTVVIVTDSISGKTVGGYTPLKWNQISDYKYDTQSRLYNLNNSESFSTHNIMGHRTSYAILTKNDYGPTFGGGHDLTINPNGGTSYCATNNTYSGWNLNYCHSGSSKQYPTQPEYKVYYFLD